MAMLLPLRPRQRRRLLNGSQKPKWSKKKRRRNVCCFFWSHVFVPWRRKTHRKNKKKMICNLTRFGFPSSLRWSRWFPCFWQAEAFCLWGSSILFFRYVLTDRSLQAIQQSKYAEGGRDEKKKNSVRSTFPQKNTHEKEKRRKKRRGAKKNAHESLPQSFQQRS